MELKRKICGRYQEVDLEGTSEGKDASHQAKVKEDIRNGCTQSVGINTEMATKNQVVGRKEVVAKVG